MKEKLRKRGCLFCFILCLSMSARVYGAPTWTEEKKGYEEGDYRYWEEMEGYKVKDGLVYYVQEGEAVIREILLDDREVHIPERIEDDADASVEYPVVGMHNVYIPDSLEDLYLPKTVRKYDVNNNVSGKDCIFKNIFVEEENGSLSSRDGILYSKNGRELIYCPPNGRKEVQIPRKVKKIKEYAFVGLKVKHLTIPDTVKEMERCFIDSEIRTIRLSRSLKEIAWYTFHGCYYLKEIEIPASVRKIAACAFMSCTSLRKVTFEKGSRLESIEEAAFIFDKRLKDVRLPGSLREIGKDAFSGCHQLRSVRLPEGMKTLGSGSFFGCKKLREVEIPKTLEQIGMEAFRWCKSLRKITVHGSGLKEIQKRAFHDIGNKKKITFAAQENSYAYHYAKKQGFCVRAL